MNQHDPTTDVSEIDGAVDDAIAYDITGDAVIELRRYTLHHGQRDVLIELFERELIEPQEALGMSVIGLFLDVDHPDTFTWLRGFTDMDTRRHALEAFYGGPVWARHRTAANATMIDSDDVLLLTNVSMPKVGAALEPNRPVRGFEIVTFHVDGDPSDTELAELAHRIGHIEGYRLEMYLRTLHAVNTFPALPVRAEANVVVAVLTTTTAYDAAPTPVAWEQIGSCLTSLVTTEAMRLEPTAHSQLR
jgi:hypothetical protein